MEEPIEVIDYKGYQINIHQDIDPMNPREWDNLGTMVCFHHRYSLGDKHEFKNPDEFLRFMTHEDIIVLPLYLFDHSGITMSTAQFNCPWDSGQVGWIYITKKDVKKEFKDWKIISNSRKYKIVEYLRNEVEIYNQFITGDVYGYTISNDDNDHIDSCWGFFGHDYKDNGLLEQAQGVIDCEIKKEKKVEQMINNCFAL